MKDKEYHRQYYQTNKKEIIQKNRTRRQKHRTQLETTMGGQCLHCHTKDKLHFHHIHPKDKFATISDMQRSGHAYEYILAEAQKCILLCQNCHEHLHDNKWKIIDLFHPATEVATP